MELRQLRSFLAVADLRHFRRAAARLHVSQPALSRQIQQLERELGTPLFQRPPGPIMLTEAGRELQARARRALDELETARTTIAQAGDGPHGHLALACFDSASTYLVPELLIRLVTRYPQVQLSVATLGTRDALRQLREGAVDAAIVTLPVASADLDVLPLYRERLVVALPRTHPLTAQSTIRLASLAPERLVTFLAGQNNTRRLIDDAFAEAGCRPSAVIELESVQAIQDAVRAGLGVAILGELTLTGSARDTRVLARPLSPPRSREIGLVTRSSRQTHPLVAPLVGLLRETATALDLADLSQTTSSET
ncbi:MAG TPA: LysR substrate-binding domain-containing protein [Chloroflexota bacterium]|jgi:DNA-binding transcriptional LysR family regulator